MTKPNGVTPEVTDFSGLDGQACARLNLRGQPEASWRLQAADGFRWLDLIALLFPVIPLGQVKRFGCKVDIYLALDGGVFLLVLLATEHGSANEIRGGGCLIFNFHLISCLIENRYCLLSL
jgi:hypothetical protein